MATVSQSHLHLPPALVARGRSSLSALQSIGSGLGAWLDLAIRFWLAQAFLAGAAVSVMMHAPPTMVGDGAWVTVFNILVDSPLGFAIQTICPILLFLGLFSRLAAIPLLVQSLFLSGPEGPSDIHLFWIMLLGRTIILGAGPLSLDALLGSGLDSIAVPGAKRIGLAYAGITRALGPAYWLFLRLWIATAPAGVAFATYRWSNPMQRGMIGHWLASVPAMVTASPAMLCLLIAALLIFGLGTRLAAFALLIMIPIGQVSGQADDRLYWMLLLATLVVWDAGPLALDHLLDRWLTRLDKLIRAPRAGLPHVVIVGGGFGGLAAARKLSGASCRITIVDQRNYHLFQPLLYQVATAGLSPADIATPIRSMFRTQSDATVVFAKVLGVAPASREVLLDRRGPLRYDFLVLATGSRHSYFGRDEWAADAPGLKRIEDATDIRRRLLLAFEHAENASEGAERGAWLTFVVVGGGPTGVELAGAIAELALHGLHREFRSIDPANAKIILIQSATRILPTFAPSLAADAKVFLQRLGVDVRVGVKVEHVDSDGVVMSGERIRAKTVLWAAGVAASPAGHWLGAVTDKAERLVVGPDLSVSGHKNVFAIGDTAASMGWKGKPVPGLAPAAKQGGQYVAKVIRARLANRPAPRPFSYRHLGGLATIGRQAAVAEFGPIRLHGALAWWVWGAIHIMFLVGGRNRAAVMLEWAWAYLTYRRGTRLITDPHALPASDKQIIES